MRQRERFISRDTYEVMNGSVADDDKKAKSKKYGLLALIVTGLIIVYFVLFYDSGDSGENDDVNAMGTIKGNMNMNQRAKENNQKNFNKFQNKRNIEARVRDKNRNRDRDRDRDRDREGARPLGDMNKQEMRNKLPFGSQGNMGNGRAYGKKMNLNHVLNEGQLPTNPDGHQFKRQASPLQPLQQQRFNDKRDRGQNNNRDANRVQEQSTSIDIPENVLSSSGSIFVRYTLPTKSIVTQFGVKSYVLIFLHGAKFSSRTWSDLGTLQGLAERGYTCIALDLPYYDQSKPRVKQTRQMGQREAGNTDWLVYVISELLSKTDPVTKYPLIPSSANTMGIFQRFVLIAPSMSGKYAIPMLAGPDSAAIAEALSPIEMIGCITVAPVGTEAVSLSEYRKVQIPVAIIYGENDKRLGETSKENLENIRTHKTLVIPNGDHACYMENKGVFHRMIIQFLSDFVHN